MGRRVKSFHHNLGDKNVVFHREHRSKKNRRNRSNFQRKLTAEFKHKKLEILTKELNEDFNNRGPRFRGDGDEEIPGNTEGH